MNAHREAYAQYACAENGGEERPQSSREPRKGDENDENAEKYQNAGSGHTPSISGLYNDDKLTADGVGMGREMLQ